MTQNKRPRKFSVEFKREILARVDQGEKISELAIQHNLTVQTIYNWRRQLRDKDLDAVVDQAPRVEQFGVSPKYVRSLEEKLREANEKLGELYIVVEALKKMDPGSLKSASSYIVTGRPWGQLKRRAK
jgi:transposase-like protein